MMLAPLTDYKHGITLIQDSGIQFMDFALTPRLDAEFPGKFVRKTASGPLLRLQWEAESGKYQLPAEGGQAAEVVRPEFSYPLQQSLRLLDKLWLPLPFLRYTASGIFLSGPDNWARLQVVQLDEPDQDGNLLRVVLAFDTRAAAPGQEALAPGESDLGADLSFALAHRNHELGEFLDLTWVDGWLREAFSQRAAEREQRAEAEINAGLKTFEYQAHYLNLLHMLGHQLTVPQIKIAAATLQQPAIDVDLVLDVGNSHTCGVLVEDHPEESNGLKQTYELQLRSLSNRTASTTNCSRAGWSFLGPRSASRICPSRADATTPSNGRPSPASAVKPHNWRSDAKGMKAPPASPARAAICGTKSAMRPAGASTSGTSRWPPPRR